MLSDLRRLMKAPAWRWTPGMRGYDNDRHPFRVRVAPTDTCDGVIDYEPRSYTFEGMPGQRLCSGALPDITDHATLGCMRALAREALADPTLHIQPFRADYCSAEPQPLWIIASRPIGESLRYLSLDAGLETGDGWTHAWTDHIEYAARFRAEGYAFAAAIITSPKVTPCKHNWKFLGVSGGDFDDRRSDLVCALCGAEPGASDSGVRYV